MKTKQIAEMLEMANSRGLTIYKSELFPRDVLVKISVFGQLHKTHLHYYWIDENSNILHYDYEKQMIEMVYSGIVYKMKMAEL